MASSSVGDYSDLVQAAKSGDKIQRLIADLPRYFDIKAIAEKEGYSKVECAHDESKVLDEVREQFKKDLVTSKKIADIVKAIVPRPEKKYYLSFVIRLLVFQSGWSNLEELMGKDDCIIMMPVVSIGSATGTLEERATGRRTTFTFEAESELVISGRCSIHMEPESKAVCVVLSIGKDKE